MKIFGLFNLDMRPKEKYLLLIPSNHHIIGLASSDYYDAMVFNNRKEMDNYISRNLSKRQQEDKYIFKQSIEELRK